MFHPSQFWLAKQIEPIRRMIGRPASYLGYPDPTLESQPRTLPCRPALFEADHLSRVTRCGFSRKLPELVDVISARSYLEGPLTAYDWGSATVIGGTIFAGNGRFRLSHLVECGLRQTFSDCIRQDEVVLVNSMQGLRYFGHWLSDDVSAFEAYRGDARVLSLPLPAWGDTGAYMELFDQDWRQRAVIQTQALRIVRDLGFSARKAQRYRTLRQRLRSRAGTPRGTGKVVFLKRGRSRAPRDIVNTAELERRLSEAGIAIIEAEGGADFIRALLDAAVIITVEGSQDRHALYALRDGGAMVTIAPPDRFYVATHEWARNLDMHSGIVIGSVAEGGFSVDPDEVLKMVDRLLARAENREAI